MDKNYKNYFLLFVILFLGICIFMYGQIFKDVVKTFVYNIPYSENHKAFYLENGTNLIASYPGVFGVKDGYTPEAGLCLVTYLNFKEHKIIGII